MTNQSEEGVTQKVTHLVTHFGQVRHPSDLQDDPNVRLKGDAGDAVTHFCGNYMLDSFEKSTNRGSAPPASPLPQNNPKGASLRHLRHHSDPTRSPLAWIVHMLDVVGSLPTGSFQRQCPAHEDGSPSLSVKTGKDGRVLLYCHAGCPTPLILAALGCSFAHLYRAPVVTPETHARGWKLKIAFPPLTHHRGSPGAAGYRLDAVHSYGEEDGRARSSTLPGREWRLLRWRHPNTGRKALEWETVTSRGSIPGLMGVPTSKLPLYREREARMALAAGELLALVESESSADALARVGIYATTWAGGAASLPLARIGAVLGSPAPGTVVVIPDRDEPGLAALAKLRGVLDASHQVVMPAPGEDARDLLARVGVWELSRLMSGS